MNDPALALPPGVIERLPGDDYLARIRAASALPPELLTGARAMGASFDAARAAVDQFHAVFHAAMHVGDAMLSTTWDQRVTTDLDACPPDLRHYHRRHFYGAGWVLAGPRGTGTIHQDYRRAAGLCLHESSDPTIWFRPSLPHESTVERVSYAAGPDGVIRVVARGSDGDGLVYHWDMGAERTADRTWSNTPGVGPTLTMETLRSAYREMLARAGERLHVEADPEPVMVGYVRCGTAGPEVAMLPEGPWHPAPFADAEVVTWTDARPVYMVRARFGRIEPDGSGPVMVVCDPLDDDDTPEERAARLLATNEVAADQIENLLDLAREGNETEFKDVAAMLGVATDLLDEMWTGTVAQVGRLKRQRKARSLSRGTPTDRADGMLDAAAVRALEGPRLS